MMFLSRILVDKRAPVCPADGYGWHRLIWHAFSDPEHPRDFLFRVDDLGRSFRLYVLSPRKPTDPGWGQWQTEEIPPSLLQHDRYRFQVRANPTMRRTADGRRLGLFRPDLLEGWMDRKASSGGFAVEQGSLVIGAPLEYRFVRKGRMGKHIGVDFRGVLRVTDRDRFVRAFVVGIGSAKAFGFGLLLLQPVPLG